MESGFFLAASYCVDSSHKQNKLPGSRVSGKRERRERGRVKGVTERLDEKMKDVMRREGNEGRTVQGREGKTRRGKKYEGDIMKKGMREGLRKGEKD